MKKELTFLRPYLRGLPLIIFAMFIAVLVAKKYLSYLTPKFQSITKIKLADIHEGTTGSNLFKNLDVFATSNKIAGEIEVIKSKEIVLRALNHVDFRTEISRVGKLKTSELYDERPFSAEINIIDDRLYDVKFNASIEDTTKFRLWIDGDDHIYEGTFGEPLSIDGKADFLLQINKAFISRKSNQVLIDNYQLEKLSEQKAYNKVLKNLDVLSTEEDVAIVKIIYKSSVPEKAALLANTLAETYIQDYIEIKYKAAKVTSDFLSKQIDNVYLKLSSSEDKIEQYKEEENIINLRQETETDLRKIAQLKIQRTNVKMSLEAINELNEYIEKGKTNFLELAPNFEAFTDLLSTEMIKKIKQLQSEKADLLLTYKEDADMVKAVNEKIDFYTTYFIESINNTKKNLETKFQNLSADIEEAEKVFIGLPQKEKMLLVLERDFRLNQNSYIFLNEKKIEADIAKAAKMSFHRIITKASKSDVPVAPNKIVIILVAAILAMFGSIFLIFLVHNLKERVTSTDNIEKNSTIPLLFTTPRLKSKDQIHNHFQKQALTMEMGQIFLKKDIIGLTSISDFHGSSFHAVRLAKTFHSQEKKVLLLSIGQELSTNDAVFDQHHISTELFSRLSFDKIKEHINEMATGYDLTIVKNEDLKTNFIATVLMRIVDCNLFVIDSRKTKLKDMIRVNLISDKHQISRTYFVLNNDGYNPSVLYQAWKVFVNLFNKIKNKDEQKSK